MEKAALPRMRVRGEQGPNLTAQDPDLSQPKFLVMSQKTGCKHLVSWDQVSGLINSE